MLNEKLFGVEPDDAEGERRRKRRKEVYNLCLLQSFVLQFLTNCTCLIQRGRDAVPLSSSSFKDLEKGKAKLERVNRRRPQTNSFHLNSTSRIETEKT